MDEALSHDETATPSGMGSTNIHEICKDGCIARDTDIST